MANLSHETKFLSFLTPCSRKQKTWSLYHLDIVMSEEARGKEWYYDTKKYHDQM